MRAPLFHAIMVGMAFNPVTHQLWVTQNERDNLKPSHENLPPDEIPRCTCPDSE